jgi:hypothetical protein
MAKQTTFLIIDTETTQTGKVADFGAIVTNRKGEILASCGVLVREFYLDKGEHPLFHSRDADPLWGQANLPARYQAYDNMLLDGRRMLASVAAVNRWLAKVNAKYSPIATAYNKAFDWDKMDKSGIDCHMFDRAFCLWHAAANKWAKSKAYRNFVLETVAFNTPTKHGNMSYHTNAEVMARFVLGNPDLPNEPHTALEDARDYELPILARLVKSVKTADLFDMPAYNWREYQVKDWFTAK